MSRTCVLCDKKRESLDDLGRCYECIPTDREKVDYWRKVKAELEEKMSELHQKQADLIRPVCLCPKVCNSARTERVMPIGPKFFARWEPTWESNGWVKLTSSNDKPISWAITKNTMKRVWKDPPDGQIDPIVMAERERAY